MLFPTLQFVLFFALVLTLHRWAEGRQATRKGLLLAASYVFYAAWDWRFCGLMAGVSVVAWAAGLAQRTRWAATARIAGLIALLGTLAVFKYFNFFLLSAQQGLEALGLARDMGWMRVALPVGISFYTFQAISYVMDAARKEIEPRRSFWDVALYISLFPQLVAGPIVRARDFLSQLDAPKPVDASMRGEAVTLIVLGLFKKMVVANYLAVMLVDPVFAYPQGQNALTAVAGTLGYGAQIYCDFSGYSDIAIGLALLLGYRFRRNFDQPYRAASLREFWRRWHISLSEWIRDYLYVPLGGGRGGPARRSAALMTAMTLSGLWHGAGWTFVAWGVLHGAALLLERARRSSMGAAPRPAGWAATFVVVMLLWIPFRAPDAEAAWALLASLLRIEGEAPAALTASALGLLAIGLGLNLTPPGARDRTALALARAPAAAQAAALAAGAALCFALAQEGVAPFIYFQF